mmetsp:Transcript_16340/g.35435  ORF Transcript_16340/g.35435 Transcript_16340/m.35435 type:complete len:212 (-) Transcript_16340:398-1033(-)
MTDGHHMLPPARNRSDLASVLRKLEGRGRAGYDTILFSPNKRLAFRGEADTYTHPRCHRHNVREPHSVCGIELIRSVAMSQRPRPPKPTGVHFALVRQQHRVGVPQCSLHHLFSGGKALDKTRVRRHAHIGTEREIAKGSRTPRKDTAVSRCGCSVLPATKGTNHSTWNALDKSGKPHVGGRPQPQLAIATAAPREDLPVFSDRHCMRGAA